MALDGRRKCSIHDNFGAEAQPDSFAGPRRIFSSGLAGIEEKQREGGAVRVVVRLIIVCLQITILSPAAAGGPGARARSCLLVPRVRSCRAPPLWCRECTRWRTGPDVFRANLICSPAVTPFGAFASGPMNTAVTVLHEDFVYMRRLAPGGTGVMMDGGSGFG